MTTARETIMATIKTRTDAEISAVIASVDAGHRMAFHEPDDFDRDLARRQLRGDILPDDAVAAAVAKVRSDHNL